MKSQTITTDSNGINKAKKCVQLFFVNICCDYPEEMAQLFIDSV